MAHPLSAVRLGLEAVVGFRRARRDAQRRSIGELTASLESAPPSGGTTDASLDAVVGAHRRAVYGPLSGGPSTCLPRALGLTRLLRRHGYDAQLVVGVRPSDLPRRGLEDGHAWVEVDGRPVDEPEGKVESYREFLRAPQRANQEPAG